MDHDPEQVFYKLSELSDLLGVESSVLRFWEKEFPQIRPMKVGPRKRLYRRKDFEIFQEIKRLLYDERFTIAGAKKRLDQPDSRQGGLFDDEDKIGAPSPLFDDPEPAEVRLEAARRLLNEIRRDLAGIREMLISRRPEPVPVIPPPISPRPRKKKPAAGKPSGRPPRVAPEDAPATHHPSGTQDLPHDPSES